MRVRPVITMKHYWEVDVGLSESAKNLTLGDLAGLSQGHESENRAWRRYDCSYRPMVHRPIDKNVHRCSLSKSAS